MNRQFALSPEQENGTIRRIVPLSCIFGFVILGSCLWCLPIKLVFSMLYGYFFINLHL